MIDVLTGLLVVITGFYAWATYRILKANERVVEVMHSQSEAMTRPYVTIAPILEIDSPVFRLKISNTGKTAANHLQLTLDKAFHQFGETGRNRNLASFPAFQDEITSLAPGSEITFALAIAPNLFNESADEQVTPKQFSITAEYSYGDNVVNEINVIDLRPYFMADILQDPHAKKLKEIKDEISKISMVLKKIADQQRDGR
jgi:hypothetical protein